MTQATWPLFPHPLLLRQFQILRKIDSFLKNVSNVLDRKLCPCWTAWTTFNYWLAFFLFHCGLQEKLEPTRRNCFFWTADWGWEHNLLDPQNTLMFYWQLQQCKWFFKQKIISASLLIAGIHSSSKSKKFKELMNGQIIDSYSPSKCTLFIWRISTDKTF